MKPREVFETMLDEIGSATTNAESAAIAIDNLASHGRAYGQPWNEPSYDQKTALLRASDALLEADNELRKATRLVEKARALTGG